MTELSVSMLAYISLCYLVRLSDSQARMAKHISENSVLFPANVPPKRPGSDIPVGHFRPLGMLFNYKGFVNM